MPGIYDWILNSLKSDMSPLANQLPTPLPAANITGLPVPYQNMPSESATFNPFVKPKEKTAANPVITQDVGTNPSAPNDPLKTYMIQQFTHGKTQNSMNPINKPNLRMQLLLRMLSAG